MKKSRYFHYPPDVRAYSAATIWTDDGWKIHGILSVLIRLNVVTIQDCIPK